MLLWFHGVEEWKFDDVRPDGRTGAAAYSAERQKCIGFTGTQRWLPT